MSNKFAVVFLGLGLLAGCDDDDQSALQPCLPSDGDAGAAAKPDPVKEAAERMIDEGRETFRHDTFGDEAFWGDDLRLHEAIAGQANGGVGPGVSPTSALALGLKVDVDALPADLVASIQAGQVDLNDPASTIALMKANAVVGITGFFDRRGTIQSMGIQCALCHSTVDDSFAPGIGHRLDGWANRDLNVGAIIASAPNLNTVTALLGVDDATLREVLMSWGPGVSSTPRCSSTERPSAPTANRPRPSSPPLSAWPA
jgi:hypothetical protein